MRAVLFLVLILGSSLSHARGGSGRSGVRVAVGAGLFQSGLTIKSTAASSDFSGSGFNLVGNFEYSWNEFFGVQLMSHYSESRLLNDTQQGISDDARVFTKSIGGGFVIGPVSFGGGTSIADYKIVPVTTSNLKYKYSPSMSFYYGQVSFEYMELLRTQIGVKISSGKSDNLTFSEYSYYLNLLFIIPGI